MSGKRGLLGKENGAVSVYLMLILLPLLLLLGLLIDVLRWRTADQQAELAVKAGVRSVLAGFSKPLQAYGLFALDAGDGQAANRLFAETVADNLAAPAEGERFAWTAQTLEKEDGDARLTAIYPLSSHQIFKRQILEEMKYRAPISYSLELIDKWRKNGIAANLGQASRFGGNAAQLERLLEERDSRLETAWKEFEDIRGQAAELTPFYRTQLRDLNALSSKIGVHTLENARAALQNAQAQARALEQQIKGIDASMASLAQAGAAAVPALIQLSQAKSELNAQYREAIQLAAEFEELLRNFARYAELLLVIRTKTSADLGRVQTALGEFQQAHRQAVEAGEAVEKELERIRGGGGAVSGTPLGSQALADTENRTFAEVQVLSRQELDTWQADVVGAVAQFAGFDAQMNDGLWFTQAKYTTVLQALEGFQSSLEATAARMSPTVMRQQASQRAIQAGKREQRSKTEAVLSEVRKSLGVCSLTTGADPFENIYLKLEGDSRKPDAQGLFSAYMTRNAAPAGGEAVPAVPTDSADRAGLGALKLAAGLEQLLTDVRDEFYVDEYAVTKFSYRTLGLGAESAGAPRKSKELSLPEQHPLTNQEVEYLIYGADSCAGNYSLAYAEMFAFRLAVGTAEALLEPRNEALAAGSPLLVLLAAVAEGAVRAQQDMAKLIQGEEVALSRKLSQAVTLNYRDYLRIFLLLHSRESVLLSRMQALIHYNTSVDLSTVFTYASGQATVSFRFWFMGGILRSLGAESFGGCGDEPSRCMRTKTADYHY
ncbi:hypothetical protein SAMN02799630_00212 [Paenibacillus sp. UNCCL117]|uniref:hypothetical protein n=1 Tax=unclassified Paenibacillus TaxID=185978 RepID=UPI00087ECB03|nr:MULTISPECIES: hypothetical protein [unclassified Paenibacillus]SDC48273.1 hypothetical protein SAMN04488602_102320 [Paenibacillus sp. cl123]SFW11973.1 hypothetical protein SAMN02799630_00212 [Paenibacillus sp. UNCCL117]